MTNLDRLSAAYANYLEVVHKERLSVMASLSTFAPEIVNLSTQVLESEDAAFLWLMSPARALGMLTPIEAIINGRKDEVMALLGRIEYGVYS